VILGTTTGVISGGTILKIVRQNTFILASVIVFNGSSFYLVKSMTWILIGRLIYGVGCGIFKLVGLRFIEVTVPDRLLSLYSTPFMCSVAFGSTIALLMGAGLPDDNKLEALKNIEFWLAILVLPILL
jgi:hypothetical protein